jgi:4-amino-4-deoxy-L-arabinose transferase-like glycosyltransferase
MSLLTGYLVYLPAALSGILWIHQLWRGNRASSLLFKAGLGTGLGLGFASLLAFLLLSVTKGLDAFMAIQFILLACGIVLAWINWKNNPLLPVRIELIRIQKILSGVFLFVLVITLAATIMEGSRAPSGQIDAWLIYNRTARFIFRDPGNWQTIASPKLYWLFHADYPLLVPVNIAGAWKALGSENIYAAQAQSAYYLFGLICVLTGALGFLRSTGQAVLAGIVLLGMPVIFVAATRQEADIPLSFFILSSMALLFLYNQEVSPAFISLSGLAAGFAAWTKNEGLLFLITGGIAWSLLLYSRKQTGRLKWYFLGLFLPTLVVLAFNFFLAPPNDIIGVELFPSLFTRLTSTKIFVTIAQKFMAQFFTFGGGSITIFLLVVYGLILGLDRSKNQRLPAMAAVSALLLQLGGYFLVFMLTPHDINWQLRSSLYRLILHLVPAALLILFATITDPETVFSSTEKPSVSARL